MDAAAVGALVQASGVSGDAVIRITLSGGAPDGGEALLWMRPAPLPPPLGATAAVVAFSSWTLAEGDLLARHKTLNYWSRRLAYEQGRQGGADEVLLATSDGRIWEGTIRQSAHTGARREKPRACSYSSLRTARSATSTAAN